VLDAVAGGAAARPGLNRDAVLLLGLYVVGAAAKLAEVALLRLAGERIVFDLRERLFSKMVGQDVARLDEESAGSMLSRLQSDSYDLQAVVTKDVPAMVTGLMESALGFAMLLYICRPLFPVVAATVPLTVLAATHYGRRTAGFARALSAALARASDAATEQLSGVRVVKAFARERLAEQRYGAALADVLANGNKVAVADATLQAWNRLVFTVKTVAILWLGARYVAMGALSVGGLFSFAIYTSNIAASLGKLAGGWGELLRSSGAVSRILEILDTSPRIECPPAAAAAAAAAARPPVAGDIEFRDVSFAYPTRRGHPALSGVSFSVPAGSSVALCGRSGAGKSSIVSLLERFHDPTGGSVLVDGKPLADYDLRHLRGSVIGLVPQEPVLFSGTIAENIGFGKLDATRAEVQDAARDAGVLEFVDRLPLGLDTPVGPAAGTLSGGEKQRVMIARCLCKRPRILLLDEATSALDAVSEAMVNETIDRLMADSSRTIVLISHRLSIAKRCDRILVLERGVLRESGTHAQLETSGGLYAELLGAAPTSSAA
jgi:ATP-binding cassette, subfamily B, bacterial